MVPCKLREDRLVPVKGAEQRIFTETGAIEHFKLDIGKPADVAILRSLNPAAYIGMVRSKLNGSPVRFYARNHDLSGDVSWVLKQDPTFSDRLLEAWLVVSSQWDSKVIEIPT